MTEIKSKNNHPHVDWSKGLFEHLSQHLQHSVSGKSIGEKAREIGLDNWLDWIQ